MYKKPHTTRLHNDIRKSYEELAAVVELGVQKYSTDYIINRLAKRYYRSTKTIENIVFREGGSRVLW